MPDLIRYDLLVQDALRGVVRHVLSEVARNGLQGEHHFFVTFKTATPGLRLSNRMRERYPDEMTIILQHQFWGLSVQETGFEVGLSFHNTPEKLFVPFASITMFQDPSVNFGLKFDVREGEAAPEPQPATPALAPPKPATAKKSLVAVESSGSKPQNAKGPRPEKAKPVLTPVPDQQPEAGESGAGPKVVSIDAFRKKP
ncbi:MAG: Stringent starvation protein B [Parafilimonas terrae]|nr:Stringent starvation protein B [Parafilimonas terrae]